jgi:hypothetical protein
MVIGRLIYYHQTAFIMGRFIMEIVVTAHEIIHEVHRNKKQGLLFKIDYGKAYDKLNLYFLYEVLELRGSSSTFVRLIKQNTQGVLLVLR